MQVFERIWRRIRGEPPEALPLHLQHGRLGESAAKDFLKRKGYKFLTANFATRDGELDLVFRDGECLVFVEVKTRSSEAWTRPAMAVNTRKRRLMAKTARDYLRRLPEPNVTHRFDIVEVLLDSGGVREIRHIERIDVHRRGRR